MRAAATGIRDRAQAGLLDLRALVARWCPRTVRTIRNRRGAPGRKTAHRQYNRRRECKVPPGLPVLVEIAESLTLCWRIGRRRERRVHYWRPPLRRMARPGRNHFRRRDQHNICSQHPHQTAPLDRKAVGHRHHERITLPGADHRLRSGSHVGGVIRAALVCQRFRCEHGSVTRRNREDRAGETDRSGLDTKTMPSDQWIATVPAACRRIKRERGTAQGVH